MKTETRDTRALYRLEKTANPNPMRLSVMVRIYSGHEIFKGHFPEMPILPGVCIMQILKDSLNRFLSGHYQLEVASVVKFLLPIDPNDHDKLRMEIDYHKSEGGLNISAVSYLEDDSVHFKMKGKYIAL